MAMLFAAAHPERTRALILCGAEVRERKDEDWPWGESTPEEFEEAMASLPERWGRSNPVANYMPSHKDDERTVRLAQRRAMEAASPGAAIAFMRMAFDIDVREIASSIRVPTLIIHSPRDQVCHVENARFLARTIPGSKYLEIDAGDHVPWGDGADRIVPEIQEFLTGVRGPLSVDTVLATVLFTDIVGSSETAARLGDERWRQTLQGHQAAMRKLLKCLWRTRDRHCGRWIPRGFRRSRSSHQVRLSRRRRRARRRRCHPSWSPHRRVRGLGREAERRRGAYRCPDRRLSRRRRGAGLADRQGPGGGISD